ncbi:PDZ domain-containing protein [Luteolibacter algae]|uniref:PDZ domain-containing protein n=1 Tax=Luteolibacter algae TaxID=454151 RepID=A0ABW5D5A7_9BACT
MHASIHFAALVLVAGSLCHAREPEGPKDLTSGVEERSEKPPMPWLGLSVAKPDDTTATQLPALPPGIGFIVTDLDKDGPAQKAGVKKMDLLWKMNEQMLVNEGQLATLLRLSKPEDVVTISVFREGKSLDLKLTLGEGKADTDEVIRRVLNDSVMRGRDGAVRIVNLEQKKASYTNENGTAEVYRVESGDAVKIVSPDGKIIYEGVIRGWAEYSDVPHSWRRQICALRRGLDHALDPSVAPMRHPRPRIVPPPMPEQ